MEGYCEHDGDLRQHVQEQGLESGMKGLGSKRVVVDTTLAVAVEELRFGFGEQSEFLISTQ